ncbi:hypothetical protein BJX99DRAFT_257800 [Aspergillus californicus]
MANGDRPLDLDAFTSSQDPSPAYTERDDILTDQDFFEPMDTEIQPSLTNSAKSMLLAAMAKNAPRSDPASTVASTSATIPGAVDPAPASRQRNSTLTKRDFLSAMNEKPGLGLTPAPSSLRLAAMRRNSSRSHPISMAPSTSSTTGVVFDEELAVPRTRPNPVSGGRRQGDYPTHRDRLLAMRASARTAFDFPRPGPRLRAEMRRPGSDFTSTPISTPPSPASPTSSPLDAVMEQESGHRLAKPSPIQGTPHRFNGNEVDWPISREAWDSPDRLLMARDDLTNIQSIVRLRLAELGHDGSSNEAVLNEDADHLATTDANAEVKDEQPKATPAKQCAPGPNPDYVKKALTFWDLTWNMLSFFFDLGFLYLLYIVPRHKRADILAHAAVAISSRLVKIVFLLVALHIAVLQSLSSTAETVVGYFRGA